MRKDQPSRTAFKVALNILKLSAKPGMDTIFPPCVVEATASLLVASGLVNATVVRWLRSRRMVPIYKAFDWMMPGQFEAFAHRKAFCTHQIKKGIHEGAIQVLNLGAGYDTTGWCLALEFPDVEFFEIDHPSTAQLKKRGVEKMGVRDNLHLIAADLTKQKIVEILTAQKAWKKSGQTVVLAEGLLMYLPDTAVRDLFTQCTAMTGANSRIVFTYVSTRADGRPDAGPLTMLILWTLKLTGEPWLWSIQPEQLNPFLGRLGWRNIQKLPETTIKYGVEFFAVATK